MVLFDPVMQVFTLAYPDRLQTAPGAILQAICGVTGHDSLQVGLATVNDDAVGSAMTCQHFPEKQLGRRQVTLLAEPEFDCVADAVDGAVKIHPLAADLDVSLVDMPLAVTLRLRRLKRSSSSGAKRTVQR
jgi:hypothetical protein